MTTSESARVGRLAVLSSLFAFTNLSAQPSVNDRVNEVRSGTVRLSFASRPDVCGNGSYIRSGKNNYTGNWSRDQDLQEACEPGPVRVVAERVDGRTVHLRSYVGGRWKDDKSARDLGTVEASSAAEWLLREAESGPEEAAKNALMPLTLADVTVPWLRVLEISKNQQRPRAVRSQAVFWAAQAAGVKAADEIGAIAQNDPDKEVRAAAVFALSRRDDGFDQLIRIARTSKDRDVKQSAYFWIGQSKDPRAADFLAEVLARP